MPCFLKVFPTQRKKGLYILAVAFLMVVRTLAQFLSPLCFWCGCIFICPFLDEFWDLLVLGSTEQLQSSLLMGSKATHLPYELGVFDEVPPAATVPGLPLLKSTAIG